MPNLKFDPDAPLYTSNADGWGLNRTKDVLNQLYATGKPIVVFIHGRGEEPRKSLRGATFAKGLAVHKLELGYDVKVLMFNWDSDYKGIKWWDRKRPLENVPPAAVSLGVFLSELSSYLDQNPHHPLPILLAHSMGSIVVQRTIQDNLWPLGRQLFGNVLLTEPDADDVGHAEWVDLLATREKVYVTMNRDDGVLLKSKNGRSKRAHALGLGTAEQLAKHAIYIDLTGLGPAGSEEDDDHEVFGKGAMNGQLHVCRFFAQALRGEGIALVRADNVEEIDRDVVYRLRSKLDPGNPCLRIPKLPTFKE